MARRINHSSVNWALMAELVPKEQRNFFLAFKTRSDTYLKKMMMNPPQPPKIDWAAYKMRVPIAGMVDEFQKAYDTLKIPFPPDNMTKLVDEQEKQIKVEIDAFKADSNRRIEQYKGEISQLSGLLPYEEMTMEDFKDAHPDIALDPLKRPTFWPHTPEDQPVEDDGKPQAH